MVKLGKDAICLYCMYFILIVMQTEKKIVKMNEEIKKALVDIVNAVSFKFSDIIIVSRRLTHTGGKTATALHPNNGCMQVRMVL
jgi:hypothetical protein